MITYLNYQSPFGRETVDEIEQKPNQTKKEYQAEIYQIAREYNRAGLVVYASRRACANWK